MTSSSESLGVPRSSSGDSQLPLRGTPRNPEEPRNYEFEFEGVVRLTRIGTAYLLSTIVMAIAALNTGNNALYIAVSFMLGCLLLSGIASKSGLKHLEVEIEQITEAWAGKTADGVLRVRNRSKIWSVRDVVFVSGELASAVLVPIVPKKQEITVPATFLFQRRGVVELKTIDSYTRYPFGFVLKKRRLRVKSEVIVYPRLLEDRGAQERFHAVTGDAMAVNRPGPGTEIHSFRDYVPGDSMRHVYWKKSASLGRWIMKQTEADAARSVRVVVNPYRPRNVSSERFEEMISEAATFMYDALGRGFDVMLSLPRIDVHVREGQNGAPIFRALALVEPRHEPVELHLDRDTVYFSAAGGQRDAKTA